MRACARLWQQRGEQELPRVQLERRKENYIFKHKSEIREWVEEGVDQRKRRITPSRSFPPLCFERSSLLHPVVSSTFPHSRTSWSAQTAAAETATCVMEEI